MGDVIKLPTSKAPAASTAFDAIAWLHAKLEDGQPEHRAMFIRKRIAYLEAQRKSN